MDADNLHVAVSPQADHNGHRLRSLIIDKTMGIKTIYCQNCSTLVDYVFRKAKGWQPEQAQKYATTHRTQLKSFSHIAVDQEKEFLKVVGIMVDDTNVEFQPNAA
jgi:hypothetical protein